MNRSLVVLVLTALAAPLFGDTAARYIVMTRPAARERQISLIREGETPAAEESHDIRAFREIDGFAATLTAAEVAQLKRSPYVRYVTPVVERHLLDAPSPSFQPATNVSVYQQEQTIPYGIDLVRARELWPYTRGFSMLIHVAILDTGIDYNHPELIHAYRQGFNTVDTQSTNFDDNHHGTHVAGIIAAADNKFGVVGVAPEANLWCVKVLDKYGAGSNESLMAGLDWVLAKKAEIGGNWIVSLSLGSTTASPAELEAFQKAVANGLLIIAAAGNSDLSVIDFPAQYPGVMAVGAVDSTKNLASFSNHGARLDIVAPGVDVLSTVPVGTALVAEVVVSEQSLDAVPLTGSPKADVTAPIVLCGTGQVGEFPPQVKDAIAFIRRGNISFNEKVRNAKAAGAKGVVIEARQTDADDRTGWTLIRPCSGDPTCAAQNDDKAFDWPLTVSMSYADGEKALAASGPVAESYRGEDYESLSGTSMATPHVSGIAALIWSLAPTLSANDIFLTLQSTAKDLGTPGYDPYFGYGMIDAVAAAKKVAPSLFGLPTQPPPTPPTHRRRATH